MERQVRGGWGDNMERQAGKGGGITWKGRAGEGGITWKGGKNVKFTL